MKFMKILAPLVLTFTILSATGCGELSDAARELGGDVTPRATASPTPEMSAGVEVKVTITPRPSASTIPEESEPPQEDTPVSSSHEEILNELVRLTDARESGETKNYYWLNGIAQIDSSVMPASGEVSFGADERGRSAVARGSLTYGMFEASKGSRQGEPLDPPYWPSGNREVEIPSTLTGKSYHGYMYNRSHSIADSLAGEASYSSEFNFITGVRTQNTGADSHGGMRAAEELAENYWKSHEGSKETIWYQVTPLYYGDETMPRGTVIDELSSDGALNVQLVVINAAEGWDIDYSSGSFTSAGAPQSEPSVPVSNAPVDETSVNDSSCTKTSSGNCIKAGQLCSNAMHDKSGTLEDGTEVQCSLYDSGTWHWKK